MRKWTVYIVIAALILGGGGWFISQRMAAGKATNDAPTETAVVVRDSLAVTVDVTGSLLSPSETTLAFETGGRLTEVLVAEEQSVKAGDVLARLDSNALELQLAQAELNLQLLTSPEAIAQAELAVLNAREARDDAERDLASVQHPDVVYYQEQLDRTQNALLTAQQNAEITDIGSLQARLQAARDALKTAEERLGKIQAAINGCSDCDPNRSVTVDRISMTLNDAQDAYNDALNRVRELELQIDQANRNNTQVIADAQEAVDDAKANLAAALAGPDSADVAQYQARVEKAQAALSAAEALLADLHGGLTYESLSAAPPVIGSTQGQLHQAILSVHSAQLSLEKAALIAPASGRVTTVRASAGEFVGPGTSLIVLSELDSLQAEVNLDETDVACIHAGMPVAITVDAFPRAALTGVVSDIAPSASVQSGVVLYPVTIRLDSIDLPLRPGMTVNATFTIEKRENTLIVPFRAVETEGGQAFVTLQTTAGSQRVPVKLGLITDTQIEILSGISEGDAVAVYANPVQDSSLQMQGPFGGGK
jgi:HlyD family secretion protein